MRQSTGLSHRRVVPQLAWSDQAQTVGQAILPDLVRRSARGSDRDPQSQRDSPRPRHGPSITVW